MHIYIYVCIYNIYIIYMCTCIMSKRRGATSVETPVICLMHENIGLINNISLMFVHTYTVAYSGGVNQ